MQEEAPPAGEKGGEARGQQNGHANGNSVNGNGVCVASGEAHTGEKRPHPGENNPGTAAGRLPKMAKQQRAPKKKFRGRKPKKAAEGSAEEVLLADVQSLLETLRLKDEEPAEPAKPAEENGQGEQLPERGTEIELQVVDLSSTGDGLAVPRLAQTGTGSSSRPRVYVVSFAIPGDIIRARVYRHLSAAEASGGDDDVTYSVADLVEVIRPSDLREVEPVEPVEVKPGENPGETPGETQESSTPKWREPRVRCQYFGRCSGCQYQMLDYAEQLRMKRRVVERAYQHFSQLPPAQVPAILDTVASPLQYGYRTKLTPHFDGPPGFRRKNKGQVKLAAVPPIGFNQRGGGSRTVLDIEHCPIGTPAVAAGMARERARVARDYANYSKGATILLRECTKRVAKTETGITDPADMDTDKDAVVADTPTFTDIKTCVTDNNATTTEYVDDYIFTNPAGSFFQNNNSILPALTAYVRAAVAGRSEVHHRHLPPARYLIDAYSGSGLFTITLASTLPGGSVGIDIAEQSITYARTNASLNSLPPDRCRFLAADAAQLFAGVSKAVTTDPDETVVVLDPPRKGCDAPFLRQLLAYAPARIVYVSCNVHTQARDVGMLVRGRVDGFAGMRREDEQTDSTTPPVRYEIESLVGFDFFPQTAHVEGIAVLNRVDPRSTAPESE